MATADTLVHAMDRAEVSRSVVMGMGWTDLLVAREANDYIIEAVQQNPQRLTGFCSVNPAWGDAALEEAERCAAAGVTGVGELHPDTQGFDITDGASLAPFMDTARRLRLAGIGARLRAGGTFVYQARARPPRRGCAGSSRISRAIPLSAPIGAAGCRSTR